MSSVLAIGRLRPLARDTLWRASVLGLLLGRQARALGRLNTMNESHQADEQRDQQGGDGDEAHPDERVVLVHPGVVAMKQLMPGGDQPDRVADQAQRPDDHREDGEDDRDADNRR